jgi:hypothetical protein
VKAAAALLMVALPGCSVPRSGEMTETEFASRYLASLEDPAATRMTVEKALGAPSMRFEGGRIAGYRFLLEWDGPMTVIRPENHMDKYASLVERFAEFQLVLVYDGDRLRERRLRRVIP